MFAHPKVAYDPTADATRTADVNNTGAADVSFRSDPRVSVKFVGSVSWGVDSRRIPSRRVR